MKTPPSESAKEPTPFERLTDFTRRIVAVPKSEVDKKMHALQARKRRRQHRDKGAQQA